MKTKLLVLFFVTYSSAASANVFSDAFDLLKQMLGINYSREVNQTVSPPAPVCEAQPSYSNGLPTSPVLTNNDDEMPVPGATAELAEEGDEKEVGFTPKDDTDADSVREDLIANYKKLGGDPTALNQALCFYDKNRSINFKASGDPSRKGGIKIQNQRYITINDLNKNYFDSRMFVLDMDTGKVKTYYSAHGTGGKKGVEESGSNATEFSNVDGSNATPRGFFITGARVNGSSDPKQRWKFSMKMHGLQEGVNDKSYARAVIMHSFPDVENDVATSDDTNPKLKIEPRDFYLSKGCTMVGPKVADEIIDTIKAPNTSSGGSLYYNYTPIEKSRGDSYCGDENLMKK
jgi:hypothetical protein